MRPTILSSIADMVKIGRTELKSLFMMRITIGMARTTVTIHPLSHPLTPNSIWVITNPRIIH
jgi:hypothetical protein